MSMALALTRTARFQVDRAVELTYSSCGDRRQMTTTTRVVSLLVGDGGLEPPTSSV
jgi:hypothetical protein